MVLYLVSSWADGLGTAAAAVGAGASSGNSTKLGMEKWTGVVQGGIGEAEKGAGGSEASDGMVWDLLSIAWTWVSVAV